MKMRMRACLMALGLAAAGCATASAPVAGAKLPSRAQRANAPPAFVAGDLDGKTAGEIDKALGIPDLTRIEGAGEFRRYALDQCALIVILYPDEKGERRVTRLDTGALVSGEKAPGLDDCLAAGRAD